eukprot:CAMPEP_0115147846 /NCGR_PEP_ID=MMETSP0227-20121206/63546_1 /TAXON_ID=89957 /ORGANISM="Polarella glacialis, Strain CCMP 1383" /LENGTH=131 /DNA_ID=CAMNT_0002557817 /DNA_START=37 /DNA_END=429 /DNA_ORIENTATION=-
MADLAACLAELSSTVSFLAERHGIYPEVQTLPKASDDLENFAFGGSGQTCLGGSEQTPLQATIERQLRALEDVTNKATWVLDSAYPATDFDAFAGGCTRIAVLRDWQQRGGASQGEQGSLLLTARDLMQEL